MGKIAGSTLNLAGHLQKACPEDGGILSSARIADFLEDRTIIEKFSLKGVHIKGEEYRCYYYPLDPTYVSPDVIGGTTSIKLNLEELYGERALVEKRKTYLVLALKKIGQCQDVTLTGSAPVWLYLLIARDLHGRISKLTYNAPNSGDIIIFDHTQPRKKK